MKKRFKKIIPIILVILVLVILIRFIVLSALRNRIPNDYIAVFHGGSGERTTETYVYKLNMGYEYINVTSTTISYGSSKWRHEITQKGKVSWTEEVIDVAIKNNATQYVTVPNDDETYSFYEFQNRFLTK